jgi:hypothetical protein
MNEHPDAPQEAFDEPTPAFTNWKEAWEWHAEEAAKEMDALPEARLLELIQQREYDPYYQIWHSLAKVGNLATAAPVLLEVLRSEEDYLILNNAATALLKLMGYDAEAIEAMHLGEEGADEPTGEPELVALHDLFWRAVSASEELPTAQAEAERLQAVEELAALVQKKLAD